MPTSAEPAPSTALAPALRVFVLGQFRVVGDGRVLSDKAWQRPQARQLFKYLATRRFRRLPKQTAINLYWPESDSLAAGGNLRRLVFDIRNALRQVGGEQLLSSQGDSLSLDPSDTIWIDVDAFDELVAQARTAEDPLPMLEAASELYRGDFLAEDVYEDWAYERREALRLVWQDVQFRLAQGYEQRGQREAALTRLLALLQADRANEHAGQEAMRLLIELGRRPAALRVFNALQLALQDELGETPTQRTLDLQRLAAQPGAPAASIHRFRCAYAFPQPRELIGRTADLERLQRVIERGRTSGQAVLLSAPAGTGKSALLGALVRTAQERGVLCLVGGSYDQRSAMPLVAFEEALTDYILSSSTDEMVDVVVELRRQLALDVAPATDLFGAVLAFVRSMAERSPVLLCLEDLHAADAASLQLFQFLVHQTRQSPVVIVGTFRPEALRTGEPLTQLVSSLELEGIAEHIRLAPLDRPATIRLAGLLVDEPIEVSAGQALHELTGGNPLFVEQVMLTLGSHGRLDELGSVGPSVMRELVSRRLAEMSQHGRATIEIAAVLGNTFDEATLLAVAAPIDTAALIGHLSEAIEGHILRRTPSGYAFQHPLLREGVYWNLSRPRRTLLQRRVDEVLSSLLSPRA
jgi:DNA-binding SARP family transcriptional activator